MIIDLKNVTPEEGWNSWDCWEKTAEIQ